MAPDDSEGWVVTRMRRKLNPLPRMTYSIFARFHWPDVVTWLQNERREPSRKTVPDL